MNKDFQAKRTRYYADVTADINLYTDGAMNRPASKILAGVAGNIAVLNDDGLAQTIKVPAGVWVEGSFKQITDTGTTALELIVVWYG